MSHHAHKAKARTHRAGTQHRSTERAPRPADGVDAMRELQASVGNSAINDLLSGSCGAGRPLPPNIRRDMEQRFGRDFAAVRVHDDAPAADAAAGLSSKAFTVGAHIVFGEGRFVPDTREGKHLIAHELAHVIQQSRSGSEKPRIDGQGPLEAEAGRAADAAAAGAPVVIGGASQVGPAAETDDEEKEEGSLWDRASRGLQSAKEAASDLVPDEVKETAADLSQSVLQTTQPYRESLTDFAEGTGEKLTELGSDVREQLSDVDPAEAIDTAIQIFDPTQSFVANQVKERLDAELESGSPLANYVEEHRDEPGPGALAGTLLDILRAKAKYDNAPREAFAEKLAEGRPIDAIKAWQDAITGTGEEIDGKKDKGALGELKDAVWNGINAYEDGKFNAPPEFAFDPAVNPTLANVEQSLFAADQFVSKYARQVPGGAAKALFTMGEGLTKLGVHPWESAKGLGELPNVPMGPPGMPSLRDVGLSARLAEDLFDAAVSDDPDKTFAAAMAKHEEAKKFDPKREYEKSVKLAEALGENYINAWKEGRYGELPGLALVDIGSFFLGFGEAGAVGKTGNVGKLGGLGKLDDLANLGKLDDLANVGKLDDLADLGKLDDLGDIGKSAPAGEASTLAKAGEGSFIDDLLNRLRGEKPANDVLPEGPPPKGAAEPVPTPEATAPIEPQPPGDLVPFDPARQPKGPNPAEKLASKERPPTDINDFAKQRQQRKPPSEPDVQAKPEVAEEPLQMASGDKTTPLGQGRKPLSPVPDNAPVAMAGGPTPKGPTGPTLAGVPAAKTTIPSASTTSSKAAGTAARQPVKRAPPTHLPEYPQFPESVTRRTPADALKFFQENRAKYPKPIRDAIDNARPNSAADVNAIDALIRDAQAQRANKALGYKPVSEPVTVGVDSAGRPITEASSPFTGTTKGHTPLVEGTEFERGATLGQKGKPKDLTYNGQTKTGETVQIDDFDFKTRTGTEVKMPLAIADDPRFFQRNFDKIVDQMRRQAQFVKDWNFSKYVWEMYSVEDAAAAQRALRVLREEAPTLADKIEIKVIY